MKTKAVIFDLDGTLYSLKGMTFRMILSNLFNLGFAKRERSARHQIAGRHFPDAASLREELFLRIKGGSGKSLEEVAKWYDGQYLPGMVKIIRNHCTLNPWVEPLLRDLRKAGYKIAVMSDYGSVADKLKALGLDAKLFDALFDCGALGGLKPCTESFQAVASALGVDTLECLMVGDRPDTDGKGAHSCGMHFFRVKSDSDKDYRNLIMDACKGNE